MLFHKWINGEAFTCQDPNEVITPSTTQDVLRRLADNVSGTQIKSHQLSSLPRQVVRLSKMAVN